LQKNLGGATGGTVRTVSSLGSPLPPSFVHLPTPSPHKEYYTGS